MLDTKENMSQSPSIYEIMVLHKSCGRQSKHCLMKSHERIFFFSSYDLQKKMGIMLQSCMYA